MPVKCPESGRRARDERGASASVFVAVAMLALVLVAGLVVDGGAQVRAERLAQVAAARAVREGSDARAPSALVGQDGAAPALAAARDSLASDGVQGSVELDGDAVVVHTTTSVDTVFLSLVGIDHLSAHGQARGVLRPV